VLPSQPIGEICALEEQLVSTGSECTWLLWWSDVCQAQESRPPPCSASLSVASSGKVVGESSE
jgi:hypothetical protein